MRFAMGSQAEQLVEEEEKNELKFRLTFQFQFVCVLCDHGRF